MSNRPAEAALLEALRDRRRNGGAIGFVVLAVGVAAMIGSSGAYYAAGLIAFTIWMAWFVLMTIDWIRVADF